MSESKDMDIELNKSFYLSEIFYGLKSESEWTLSEVKVVLMLLSCISEHRLFIKKTDRLIDIDSDEIGDKLSDVPSVYEINRNDFQIITGTRSDNLVREIKKTCHSLLGKIINTPNPLDPENVKSFKMFTWFNNAEYEDKSGKIKLKVNEDTLKRLVVFTKYTSISFEYIAPLKNKYSLYVYVVCKTYYSNKYRKNEINMGLMEFKDRLGLSNKYEKSTHLKKYVLDVLLEEINTKTDIKLSYYISKSGNKFTDITFKFSQKKDSNKQLEQPQWQPQEIEYQAIDETINTDVDDQTLIASTQLQAYGIPRNKALEYVKTYGANTCKIGIEKLLGEIQKGRDIKNISGYLISCIENAGNNSSSEEIKASMSAAEELIETRQAQEMERFNKFDLYIKTNKQDILVLLTRYEAKEKLTDELEIDMLKCLKDVVAQYDDLESMSPYYLTLRFKGDILNYAKIKSLVKELEVASKEERIAKLKADLVVKKAELDGASEQAKGLVEKEINMLKVAIADLV